MGHRTVGVATGLVDFSWHVHVYGFMLESQIVWLGLNIISDLKVFHYLEKLKVLRSNMVT